MLMEEVVLHRLQLLLDTAERRECGSYQCRFRSCLGNRDDSLLEIGVEQLAVFISGE